MAQKILRIGILINFLAMIIIIKPAPARADDDEILQKLKKIYLTAEESYVDEIDPDKLEEAAIVGMLKELDPHSRYYPPKKMQAINDNLRGEFEGIGLQSVVIDDTINVVSTVVNGPSWKAGILAGDKITQIAGKNAVGLNKDEISNLLKGPEDTEVNIKLVRYNNPGTMSFEITRQMIPIHSVDAAFIIDGTDIGYVKLERFSATAHKELVDSLDMLTAKGMKRLILDLHDNSGGYLNQAYLIADEFLTPGQHIVYTRGRNHRFDKTYYSTEKGKYQHLPLIFIANKWSASASEIVMGAMQDLDRAIIVGETTYGKGLVQRQFINDDGSGFRITTSRYYTPSGRCIQRSYADEKKYENFAGRIELKDGSRLEDLLAEIKKEHPNDSIPPIYHTKNGRPVIGGGGITPDYIVHFGYENSMTRKMEKKRVFFSFAMNYVNGHRKTFDSLYAGNFKKFLREYRISDDMMTQFRDYAISKGISWNETLYNTDEVIIKTAIKAEMTRVYWGYNEYIAVSLGSMRQANKAIELFPEAEKLAEVE